MRATLPFLIALLAAAGCARPDAVREVARSALPVAAQLEKSGPTLETRMALQRRGFAERNASIDAQTWLDRETVELLEREWKLRNDNDRLRRLTLLRDRDEAILTDPLAPLAMPLVAPVGENLVATKDLKTAISSLDRLSGAKRMNGKDLLSFAKRVGDELEKIEEEANLQTE